MPVAAAIYAEDMYVERAFSEETAARIRGLRPWLTNEYEHNALRADGARVWPPHRPRARAGLTSRRSPTGPATTSTAPPRCTDRRRSTQLREIVARAPRVHALGTSHSFSDVADSAELVALDALPTEVDVDRRARTVTCGAGLKYGELADALAAHGVALHNLASLPHISIAGAIATATHGSGDANGNLATAVRALELVTSDGEVSRWRAASRTSTASSSASARWASSRASPSTSSPPTRCASACSRG